MEEALNLRFYVRKKVLYVKNRTPKEVKPARDGYEPVCVLNTLWEVIGAVDNGIVCKIKEGDHVVFFTWDEVEIIGKLTWVWKSKNKLVIRLP